MNRDDLMNAMSGIDPKYIDEAAFELHEKSLDRSASESSQAPQSIDRLRKAKKARLMKGLFVALPAAAAILLTTTVLLSGILRQSKNESASFAPAEGAASDTAPAYETEDAAEESKAEEPAMEESYEEAEYDEAAAGEAAAEEPAQSLEDAMGEAAPAFDLEAPENAAPSLNADEDIHTLMPESEGDEKNKNARGKSVLGLEKAEYSDGLLTLKIINPLPSDLTDLKYSITAKNTDGSDKTCAEGRLGDILKTKDPLTLDLSGLKLSSGTYTLSIGDEKISFGI